VRVSTVEVTGWEEVLREALRIADEFSEECEDGDGDGRKFAGAEYELVLRRFMFQVAFTVAAVATGRHAAVADAMAAVLCYAGLFLFRVFVFLFRD
jgi:hypothetical protein